MNFIKAHKYHFIGCGIIVLLFAVSIHVRKENLTAPLARNHEWITAHSLITAEIWNNNGGPSTYNFSPVYTKKGTGNAYRRMLGGISAENGDVYYVSYPPFAFINLYYGSQILGGISVTNIRIISLFIHILTAILLYFLVGSVWTSQKENHLNIAGIIAAGFYIFAQGNLWFHGNLYFADQVVQPLVLGALLIIIRYYKGNYKNERNTLIFLFLFLFLATYTEWLGLFTAFFAGITFLVLALIKKQRKFFRVFIVAGIASGLALSLTVMQYSSIDGWDELKAVSQKKYTERSGQTFEKSNPVHTLGGEGSFEHISSLFNSNYKSVENYLGIVTSLFILLFLVSRLKRFSPNSGTYSLTPSLLLLALVILPIVTHYLVFFNFNSVHEFSGIKTGMLLMLIIAIIIQAVQHITSQTNTYYSWSILALLCGLFVFKATKSTERYLETYNPETIDFQRINSALKINELGELDEAVFTNVRLSPEQVYYAGHSISPVPENDTSVMHQIMDMRRNDKGKYFHHSGSELIHCVGVKVVNNQFFFTDTLYLK